MIVDRHRQRLLRVFLADAGNVQLPFDLRRLGDAHPRLLLLGLGGKLLVEDLLAQDDAIVADENSRPLNELFDFGVGLSAKAAEGDVGWPGHLHYAFLSATTLSRPGISLRDCTTSSTRP